LLLTIFKIHELG